MEIRDLDEGDLEAALDVRNRSFGPLGSGSRDQWFSMQREAIAERRLLAAYDGTDVAAIARINDFRQWWLGRPVRMAGIGGVVVRPEARGRGVGRALMRGILDRGAELGYALSALFPATVPVYRAVGYELAGAQRLLTLPAADVRTLAGRGPYVDVRRPRANETGDAGHVRDMISGLHAENRDAGPIEYRVSEWQQELEDPEYFMYLAADGFVGYGFEDGSKRLRVSHLVGASEATLRSLWALVGSGSSVATHVRVAVAPDDPLLWLLPDLHIAEERAHWWMLRALDAATAIAGRGFPPGVDVTAAVRLTDRELPGNAGVWNLHVSGGAGTLERTDRTSDPVELSANGFAALYAGWPLATLRRAGLARAGDPGADAALDAAFAARPYMLDYF